MVNVSLLRTQQQRLAAMNACSVLFRHQNLLRHVLKHHTLGSSPSLEVLNEGEELDTLSETLLIQKLIAKATQPSPLKAIFGKSDIEVNVYWFCLVATHYELLNVLIFVLNWSAWGGFLSGFHFLSTSFWFYLPPFSTVFSTCSSHVTIFLFLSSSSSFYFPFHHIFGPHLHPSFSSYS